MDSFFLPRSSHSHLRILVCRKGMHICNVTYRALQADCCSHKVLVLLVCKAKRKVLLMLMMMTMMLLVLVVLVVGLAG
jgi:hypothetical protein